jgi:hypothetical protein
VTLVTVRLSGMISSIIRGNDLEVEEISLQSTAVA